MKADRFPLFRKRRRSRWNSRHALNLGESGLLQTGFQEQKESTLDRAGEEFSTGNSISEFGKSWSSRQ